MLFAGACGREETAPAKAAAAPVASAAPPKAGPAPQQVAAVHDIAGLVPPGVQPRPGEPLEAGEVALAFDSRESPDRLRAWYRASARGGAIRLGSELDEGAEYVIEGTHRSGGAFTIRLAPGAGGGTTAILLMTPR